MNPVESALEKLEAERIKNISIINFIKNNEVVSVDLIGNSVIARGISDRLWVYISCNDEDELRELKKRLTNDDKCFGAIDDWIVPFLAEGKNLVWDMCTTKFYLADAVHLLSYENITVELNENDTGTVYNNSEYKKYISPEYVAQRIQKGISAGIYEDNKLVSWAITQDDGAIGFLHTLEEYRRKGYGYIVTISMIEKLRNRGQLPFAYVVESNKRSVNLLQKLGFIKDGVIHWFEVN